MTISSCRAGDGGAALKPGAVGQVRCKEVDSPDVGTLREGGKISPQGMTLPSDRHKPVPLFQQSARCQLYRAGT